MPNSAWKNTSEYRKSVNIVRLRANHGTVQGTVQAEVKFRISGSFICKQHQFESVDALEFITERKSFQSALTRGIAPNIYFAMSHLSLLPTRVLVRETDKSSDTANLSVLAMPSSAILRNTRRIISPSGRG